MGEIIQFPDSEERLFKEGESIIWSAVSQVTSDYGDGYDDTNLIADKKELPYHNMNHTMRVRNDSKLVGKSLGLNSHDLLIVEMAAAAHDIVQLKQRGEMERESATWLSEKMQESGFSQTDITAAELAILGTEPIVSQDGAMIGQQASLQEYPSTRAELIALSVACGDMASLYAPYGPSLSRDIFKEAYETDEGEELPVDNLLTFQRLQLDLLANYRFPHAVGEVLLGPLREEVISHEIWITQQIFLGTITSWDQLNAQDVAFMQKFSQ